MPERGSAARRPALPLLALAALSAAACGGPPDRSRPIASLELVDFPAPAMFKHLAGQLGSASVLELPPRPINERHDLRMSNTTERAVLDELCRLDPGFQYSMDGPALLMWPTGEEEADSPFSRRLERFRSDGSAQSVLQELIAKALPKDTLLVSEAEGRARPVRVDLRDAPVREILVAIAAQAHLAMVVEPGYVRVTPAPE